MYILGLAAYYHDSSACLLKDGKIVAAIQEERLTRKKNDPSFPEKAVAFCLKKAGISLDDVAYIGFYDKPLLTFERLIETYIQESPRGFFSFLKAMPIWMKKKVFLKQELIKELHSLYQKSHKNSSIRDFRKKIKDKILFNEHHLSHAASCFYPSPFEEAAILTVDGVGEWTTLSLAHGKGSRIEILKEIHFPDSLGLLYSAFTYYLGFKVNSGEYKLMGLAPYGEPRYEKLIKDHLIDIKEDGSFALNMKYFHYTVGLSMTNHHFHELFGRPPREQESPLEDFHKDLARSIQKVTEDVVLKLAITAKNLTGAQYLTLAGGVALNCVANGKILKEKIFRDIWVQPASGDSGGSLGVAMSIYYEYLAHERVVPPHGDIMEGALLGPSYPEENIREFLLEKKANYHHYDSFDALISLVAREISQGKVIAWHQGNCEFGPRALGSRSILGDPRSPDMQSMMNLKIKFRESFRPFAPAILRERVQDYFEMEDRDSPYMLFVAPLKKNLRKAQTENKRPEINDIRSTVPAITHVDFSARVQTVDEKRNPRFHALIKAFEKITKVPLLINTSFNVRGEPIVCSPEDSYNCFLKTGIDVLVMEKFILFKKEQEEKGV